MLIVNADDWGRDVQTTDRIHRCVQHGSVSSVSAMVFMRDSERAAAIARETDTYAGLHLNFTTEFTSSFCSSKLLHHQRRVSRFLLGHRGAQLLFHPGLVDSFEYLVRTQSDEYAKLYGRLPERLDGHHHMHLCANVLVQGLLPRGTMVRKNFSFRPGEKPVWNRIYRRFIDNTLARRHRVTDYFFSLAPLEPRERLDYIFSLAIHSVVEVETHPAALQEYAFLTGERILSYLSAVTILSQPRGSCSYSAVKTRSC
jgi:chitin disaccharide deacetylase